MNIKGNFSVLYISKRLDVERENPGGGGIFPHSPHTHTRGEGVCAPVHVSM